MSFGCCIVCSDIPENTAIASDYAYTFRRGDSENLREVLEELIKHPAKVRSLRGMAIDYVRREFNWDSIVDRLEELYRDMLSEEA
jgi:glycosyltransferase involved in cell wall biosynthesis